ncbi:MAG: protein kinase [Longimonas sp.]|uniref:protein kinase domain-containing protein n=1 Tax=Longimonas sp. TaxID=2039626 RepID=UPI0033575D20
MHLSPEQWKAASDLFDAVCDLPPDEQQAHLNDADVPDAIRAEVEALLRAEAEATSFLEAGAASLAETFVGEAVDEHTRSSDTTLMPGARVGAYRVVEVLGEGGMGVVYRAERADGSFEKNVALKVIQRGMASSAVVQRFEHERQILAQLEHPNIARLIDGGVTSEGQPYFIMEHVQGVPLRTYCREHNVSLDKRISLLADVCDAVQYAHRRLIVHRDLKPDNILVTSQGQVKLLDFGIAKLLAEDDEDPGARTQRQPMTPAYAAPEQVQNDRVTPATDVYALGVVMYELLTGERPYEFESYGATDIAEAVVHAIPSRPSTMLRHAPSASTADRTPYSPTRLQGDLDAIIMKALKKEPEVRYATAGDLLGDLERFQQGHPVQARDDTTWYRTSKFVKRHQWAVLAAFIAVSALLAGGAATLWQAHRATAEAERANQTLDFFLQTFEDVDPAHVEAQGGMIAPRDLLHPSMRRAEQLQDQPLVQASVLQGLGRLSMSLGEVHTADSLANRARMLWSDIHGPHHPEYAAATLLQAEALREQRAYAQATSILDELTSLPSARDRFDALRLRGSILYRQGRFGAAEEAYQDALAQPVDSLHRAEALLGLGDVHIYQDRQDAAFALFHEALSTYESHEPNSPRAAQAHYQLAFSLHQGQRFDEAIEHYQRALQIYESAYGPHHYQVATTQYALGRVYEDRRQLDTALSLYRASITAYDASPLGPMHLWNAFPSIGAGRVLFEQERVSEAIPYLERSLEIVENELATRDIRVALVRGLLGAAYAAEGQLSDAAPLLESSSSIFRSRSDYAPERERPTLQGLLTLYTAQGRPDEAAAVQAQLDSLDAELEQKGPAVSEPQAP